jgi:hypothetical protein
MQRMTEYFVNLFAIHSFICRSTVLVGTLAASHERFPHSVGLLWMSDSPGTKAFTYTGQHNTDGDDHTCRKRNSNPQSQRRGDQGLRPKPQGHWNLYIFATVGLFQ